MIPSLAVRNRKSTVLAGAKVSGRNTYCREGSPWKPRCPACWSFKLVGASRGNYRNDVPEFLQQLVSLVSPRYRGKQAPASDHQVLMHSAVGSILTVLCGGCG